MLYRSAAIAAAICMLGITTVLAQSPGAPLAVVDIGEVFKVHPGFNQQLEALRKEVQRHEEMWRQQAQELQQKREGIKLLQAGSPQYKEAEERLARQQAQLQTDAQLKQKEFLDREGEIYFKTYQSVQQAITAYAQHNRIGVVLRFSRGEMRPEDRPTIIQGVNRPIVYHAPALDITDAIIASFARSTPQTPPATGPGGAAPRSANLPGNPPPRQ